MRRELRPGRRPEIVHALRYQATRRPPPAIDEIHDLVKIVEQHNAAWQMWFASVGIEPYQVRYEDLDVDPVAVTCDILDFLGLPLPRGREIAVRHMRSADQLNAEWIDRYRAEITER